MNNFGKLSHEKINKIIEVSIKEFANNGYASASTNNIVKEAGISKGTLFNYFKNKKSLYLYITDYTIDYYVNHMKERMKYNHPDIFQRVLEWQELKISISTEYPMAYKFFASVFINPAEELKDEIEERYRKLQQYSTELIIGGVDLSKFKDDIDKQKALEIIVISLNGILEKSINLYKTLDDYGYRTRNHFFEELKEYIALLRKAFYKDKA